LKKIILRLFFTPQLLLSMARVLAPPTARVKFSSIRLLVIACSHGLAQQQQRPFTLSKTNKGKKK
jgi:hypothetical protein